jgi:hypothetical protein
MQPPTPSFVFLFAAASTGFTLLSDAFTVFLLGCAVKRSGFSSSYVLLLIVVLFARGVAASSTGGGHVSLGGSVTAAVVAAAAAALTPAAPPANAAPAAAGVSAEGGSDDDGALLASAAASTALTGFVLASALPPESEPSFACDVPIANRKLEALTRLMASSKVFAALSSTLRRVHPGILSALSGALTQAGAPQAVFASIPLPSHTAPSNKFFASSEVVEGETTIRELVEALLLMPDKTELILSEIRQLLGLWW